MANISYFFGEIAIPKEAKKEWEDFVENYNSPCYGVDSWNPDEGWNRVLFSGNGRWTAKSTFTEANFFAPGSNPLAAPLLRKLEGKSLPLHFTDSETCCCVLYTFDGCMRIQGGEIKLVGDFRDYPCTQENLIKLEVEECGAETPEEFEKFVREYYKLPHSKELLARCKEVLERWGGMLTINYLESAADDVKDLLDKVAEEAGKEV